MTTATGTAPVSGRTIARQEIFYGGAWHRAQSGRTLEVINPATGESLGRVADADAADVDRAVRAARAAFPGWSALQPVERADCLRGFADAVRRNADELAFLDAENCGGPVSEMLRDVENGIRGIEYFAGLVLELKGETIPMGPNRLNYTVREPLGVIGRLIAYNHPVLFATMRSVAGLAAGNTMVLKPSDQAPLSVLRLAELIADVFPAGGYNVVTGGAACGAALVSHPGVAKVAMIGSPAVGKMILRAAADTMKRVALELGGKNALVAYPDADPDAVAAAAIAGMNFTWASQSCGSTSRLFLHERHHDDILERITRKIGAYKPGLPTDPATTMGPLISRAQLDKVLGYIASAREQGARLVTGGGRPSDPALANGFFVEPTVFADVTMDMKVAREEVFGPVLSVLKWSDEDALFEMVNAVDFGLTGAVFTRDIATAHRAASRIQSGYIWVNDVGPHFLGAPFGGYKQSGLGREECLDELLSATQVKNVNVRL